jgi:YVTN family beta-propeller protein
MSSSASPELRRSRPSVWLLLAVISALVVASAVAGAAAGATLSLRSPGSDSSGVTQTSTAGAQVTLPVRGMDAAVAASPNGPTTSPPVWETGSVTASIPVGTGASGIAYDSGNGDIYVTNFAGSVSVINGATNAVVATVTVANLPESAAYDSSNGELYVGNMGSNSVSVINGATNLVVKTIPVGSQPTWVAFDSANGDLYVPNEGNNNVTVINGATNTVAATINVGTDPVADVFDPVNGDVYVANGGTTTVSVISGSSNTVIATVNVGNGPDILGYDSGNGDIYVPNFSASTMSVISGATNTVVSTFGTGTDPDSVVYDSGNGDNFVTNFATETVSVLAGSGNSLVATLSTGTHPLADAYDGANGDVYVTNDVSNTVTVISTLLMLNTATSTLRGAGVAGSTFEYLGVGASPSGAVYDSGDSDVFVANAASANLSVINTVTNSVVATTSVGSGPTGVAVDSGNGDVYVTNFGGTTVSVVSGTSHTVVGSVNVGSEPFGIAYDSGNGDLYVANFGSSNISVINGATNTLVTTLSVAGGPDGVAYDSANGDIYVASVGGASVIVISGGTNTVVTSISVFSPATSLAYDSGNGDLYVLTPNLATVSIISGATNTVGASVSVGSGAEREVYDSGNGDVYVADHIPSALSVISGSTNAVVATLPDPQGPWAEAYDSGDGDLYVANQGSNSVSIVPTFVATTFPSTATVDVEQSLLASAPLVGEGTGKVVMTLVSSNGSGLSCSPDPIGPSAVSGACVANIPGSYTVTLTVTDSAGNSVDSSFTVRVLSTPTESVSVASPASVDLGQTTLLSTTSNGGSRLYTYNWSGLPAGCASANTASLLCTPTHAGAAFVNVTAVDTNGFVVTAGPEVLIVSSDPAVTAPVATPTSVDLFESVTINVSLISPGNGSDTYSWTGLPAGCASQNSLAITCSPAVAGTFSVAVTVGDSNGFVARSTSLTFVVAPALGTPTVTESASVLDIGQTVVLSADISGGSGTYTYSWSGLPAGCSSEDSATLACSPTGPGSSIVAVSALDSNGANVRSTGLALTVYPALQTPTITGSLSAIDIGETVTLSGTINGGSLVYDHIWSGLPAGCPSIDSATLVCTPSSGAGAYSVILTVSDSSGTVDASQPFALVVSGILEAPTITPTLSTLDVGQGFTLTATEVGGAGGYSYDWTGLPPGCPGVVGPTLSCTPSTAGTYAVSAHAQDANGMNASSTAVTLVVSPTLSAVSVTPSLPSVAVGQTLVLTVTTNGGSGVYTYFWTELPVGCVSANTPSLACTPTSTSGSPYPVSVMVSDSNGAFLTAAASPISVTNAAPMSSVFGESASDAAALILAIVAVALALIAVLLASRRRRDDPTGVPPPEVPAGLAMAPMVATPTGSPSPPPPAGPDVAPGSSAVPEVWDEGDPAAGGPTGR